MFCVAGTLGITQGVATTVVSIILTGSTVITIILALTAVLTGGIDAILTIGWSAFVTTVKKKVAQLGMKAAISW